MNRSRLTRKLEKQTIKNLILSVLGIVIILIALIKYGIPLLVNLSLFVSGTKKQESSNPSTSTFIPPPILSSKYESTNSAQVKIEGSGSPNQIIDLYINGNLVDKIETKDDSSFSFETLLVPGENIIRAKTITENGKESNLSESLTITFKSVAPTLEIKYPQDGQSFLKDQNTAEIKGTTDPHVRVTVNNFWAIIDEKNNFSYSLALKDGDNEIKIVAEDQAGNKTEKTIKVRYSP